MKKDNRIEDLVAQITRSFRPDKIILFGSYAYGSPGPDSDIDLLLIMKTRKNTLDAAAEVRHSIEHTYPIDIIVRTPAQIKQRLEWGDSFITEIMDKGKVLYETAN